MLGHPRGELGLVAHPVELHAVIAGIRDAIDGDPPLEVGEPAAADERDQPRDAHQRLDRLARALQQAGVLGARDDRREGAVEVAEHRRDRQTATKRRQCIAESAIGRGSRRATLAPRSWASTGCYAWC